ncbi:hypothetical protein AB685_14810 [Bacillus sp. LL01]|nr:hypothetical protein AB685_14810 [Bacillus sp. LL01]
MVDLPKVVAEKRKQEAAKLMQDVHARLATNNRSLDETEYKAFIREATKAVGVKQETNFNRDKFEQLRAMTSSGGNRTK